MVIQRTRTGGRGPRSGSSRYTPKRKICSFCAEKVTCIDYKDSARLARYISDRAKIEPRRRTGTCARHQRALAAAIKRARFIGLLPYVTEHIRKMGNVAYAGPVKVMPKPEVAPESKVIAKAESPAETPAA